MATIGKQLLQPESGWKRFDDNDKNISYAGDWNNALNSLFYKGSYYNTSVSSSFNERKLICKFNFTGTKLRIISSITKWRSKNIIIRIDKIEERYGENNSDETNNTSVQKVIYEKVRLTNKEHFVEIYIDALTTIRPGDNSYKSVEIDAIDIDENGELKPYDPSISSSKKYTNNIIPVMTSDENDEVKISCSAYYIGNNGFRNYGFLAFDNTVNTGWNFENQSHPIGGHWLKIFFKDKARCVSKITIRNGVNASVSIKNFKIQGSNNDNTYVDLYTGLHPFGEFNTTKASYTFKNSVKYNYYRILIIDSYYSQSTTYGGIGELEMMEMISNKYLIKQNSNYYSINNNYIDLGNIDNSEELNNIIDEYGYNDISILIKELNNKRIPTKLENDYYKSFDINLNDIKDNINLIEENDKKYIEYGCNNYKISDKVKEINDGKFEVLMKE
ncbi:cell adhesion protein [Clostridium sporogenes]|uniref:discoidin domain-containing protein n=1 Tax=Clostridium sporogenes TaxID=1509 RepID=UPI0005F07B38|nr:discoidin domain-containing protein [Clostridium sporogenes]